MSDLKYVFKRELDIKANIKRGVVDIFESEFSPTEQALRQITHKCIDTYDQKVREALIELGWTPPKDKPCTSSTVEVIGNIHDNPELLGGK